MSIYHPIEPAQLDWQDGSPISRQFGDIYFSSEGGLEESRYVFLEGNQLVQRWHGRTEFTVAETGFGTGLNFLAAIAAWLDQAPAGARLHYVAVEKHPLTPADLNRALAAWPELAPQAEALLACYPEPVHGYHRRDLYNGRVTLTLMFGDADAMFSELDASVDAWFLDGFAPGKNPDMWSPTLFQQLTRLSHAGTTFATFTAAGEVRRALQKAGFTIEKRAGFGRKREMLTGRMEEGETQSAALPWFDLGPATTAATDPIVVIGAGLAGAFCAHALVRRGRQVTVIERHPEPAQEASGNLAGVLMPRLTKDMSPEGRFYLSAFLHAAGFLDQLKRERPGLSWHRSGVLQMMSEDERHRMQGLGLPASVLTSLDEAAASQRCGQTLSKGAVCYEAGGWISPPQLCKQLLAHDDIHLISNHEALDLHYDEDLWTINSDKGELARASTVILANGYDSRRYAPELFTLQKVRGQLAYIEATDASRRLTMPVCYDGYIIPVYEGLHCCGATFDWKNDTPTLEATDEAEILAALARNLPNFGANQVLDGRVAFRTSSLDHLPLVGPVPDEAFYRQAYTDLKHGKPSHRFARAQYRPGLFINAGHGSRGLVSCGIAGELLAAQINHEPLPLPEEILQTLHPGRFLIRLLKRGKA